MKKTSIVILAVSLLICTSLMLVSAAPINDVANDEESLQEQTVVFSDVKKSNWFYEDVKYVQENNLMTGTGESEFSPSSATTRGMIVTILWRVEGKPEISGKDFEDVSSDAWYSKAVAWASSNQIVSGYSETTFGPNDTATREQLATIMYRYASYKKCDLSKKAELNKYEDKDDISYYAVESIKWANANGIISGTSETIISPKDDVQRCQVAAILKRFCENFKILDKKSENELVDSDNNSGLEGVVKENDKAEDKINSSGGASNSSTSGTGEESNEEFVDNILVQNASIKLKTTYGKAGETIPVVIDIRENPGILGVVLSLEYDENAMTLVDVENGEAVSDVLTLTHSKELSSGINFVWDGLELDSEDIKEGTMLILYFELSPDAIPGKRYPLKLEQKPGSIVDADLNRVNLSISQGYIEIER